MSKNSELLRVSQLRVALDGETIFQDLSFALQEGETLVILGPNGAGKTVLLRTLLGLLPFQGEIAWKGPTKLAYVPQRVHINRDTPITVREFFGLKGVSPKEGALVLQNVGISDASFLDKALGILSTGQLQRVLIAWAVVTNPDVLLLDEAMTGVDISGEDIIHAYLHHNDEKTKAAVILVTHDLSMVYGEATKVLVMNRQKFFFGSPVQVLDPKTLQEIYGREAQFIRHDHV